jgi:phenylalanine-4-hydroxylase
VLERPPILPNHLRGYVSRQACTAYTTEEHAAWRYLFTSLRAQLAGRVVDRFFDGLQFLRLSADAIPDLDEVDARLRACSWRAVAVDGMLPPRTYVEFLGHRHLPVVCRLRDPANLAYTPTPDIFHDLFGHAPLLVDRQYAEIVSRWGQLSCAVTPGNPDQLFPYVKQLSEAKVNPGDNAALIAELTALIERQSATPRMRRPAQRIAERLSRFGWWTIEYGLLATPQGDRLFGAALCSSLEESVRCLTEACDRRSLGAGALEHAYDATSAQDTLYTARNLSQVAHILDHLENEVGYETLGATTVAPATRVSLIPAFG